MDDRTTLRYIDELQGQIDQLKKIIKGGGGGGGSVVINPEGSATADLEKIKSGDTIYGLNYNKNANRPQINGNLLTGNKNSKQLSIAENMTEDEYADLSSTNEHEIYFLQEHASIVTETEDSFAITWEAYSDPAYVATLSYTPSDQDVTAITSVTCDTDTIEIVTFSIDQHGDVSVTIGCEDPSEVPDEVEFTFTFTQPAGSTRIMKNGLQFGGNDGQLSEITAGNNEISRTFTLDKTPKFVDLNWTTDGSWYYHGAFAWGATRLFFTASNSATSISGVPVGVSTVSYGSDGKSFTLTGGNAGGAINTEGTSGLMYLAY